MSLNSIDKETEICVCNSKSAGDIAECIKTNDLKTLKEILECDSCDVGNKCESCIDEGYNNDGLNIPLVLAMVQKSKL